MPNPATRIDHILFNLRRCWLANPELSLGQIIANAVAATHAHGTLVAAAQDEHIAACFAGCVASLPPAPEDESIPVPLTRAQIDLLLEGVDSYLYESAPQYLRNSGNVLDPRTDIDNADMSDEETAQICDLIDASDEVEAILRAAMAGPTRTQDTP